MASKHQIEIVGVANFKAIATEAAKVQKLVTDTFGKAVKVFDEDSIKAVQSQFKTTFIQIKQEIVKLQAEAAKLNKEIAAGSTTGADITQQSKDRLAIIQRIVDAEKIVKDMRKQYLTDVKGRPSDLQNAKAQTESEKAAKVAAKEAADAAKRAKADEAALQRANEQAMRAAEKQLWADHKSNQTAANKAAAEAAKKDAAEKKAAAEVARKTQQESKAAAVEAGRIALEAAKKVQAEAKTAATTAAKEAQQKAKDEKTRIQKELSEIKRSHAGAAEVGEAAVGAAKALPGVGGAVGAVAGVGAAGLGAAAAGLAGPLVGIIVAFKALEAVIGGVTERYNLYKETVDKRLQLGGMGQAPMVSGAIRGQTEALGYDMNEVMATQGAAASAMGGRGTEKDQNRTRNLLGLSRKYGMQPEQFTGAAEQMRQGGGVDVAQKNLGLIANRIEQAFGKALDKSQVPHFLNASVSLLTQINKEGLMDTGALLGAMTELAAPGKGMGAEQAARNVGGLNQSIAGSTGEANAFFQMAYNRKGLGGGSLLGSQFAVAQGLQGADLGAGGTLNKSFGGADTPMAANILKAMRGANLGGGGEGTESYSAKAAGGILDSLRDIFGDLKDPESALAAASYMNKMTGAKKGDEGAKTIGILEKIEKQRGLQGLSADQKKVFGDLGKSAEEKWQADVLTALDPLALMTKVIEAFEKNTKITSGEKAAGTINALRADVAKAEFYITGQDNGGKGLPAGGDVKNPPKFDTQGRQLQPTMQDFQTESNDAMAKLWNSAKSLGRSILGLDDSAPSGAANSMKPSAKTDTSDVTSKTQLSLEAFVSTQEAVILQNKAGQAVLYEEAKKQTKYLEAIAKKDGPLKKVHK